MRFEVSDHPPPLNPIPFQTWIISVSLVEVLAIIVGMLVLTAFGIEKKKALLASSVSVTVSFLLGVTVWLLLGVI